MTDRQREPFKHQDHRDRSYGGDADRSDWREENAPAYDPARASRDKGWNRVDWDRQRPDARGYGGNPGDSIGPGDVNALHNDDHHIHVGYSARNYARPGDSSYFTGPQGSWAVRSPYEPGGYRSSGGYSGRYRENDRGFIERAADEVASWFGNEDAARRRQEDHRGRGPKDYVRSDERIREDANDRLTESWQVDATNISVKVENGEITLDGTVANRAAKRAAEDCVEGITGVTHVQNNLRVERGDHYGPPIG